MSKKDLITHNFKECIENADRGSIVSFFAEEMTLLSQKTALSQGISIESPYVLLQNGKRFPIQDADDLEMKIKGMWTSFFEKHNNPKGLEDFIADREQDTPQDRN